MTPPASSTSTSTTAAASSTSRSTSAWPTASGATCSPPPAHRLRATESYAAVAAAAGQPEGGPGGRWGVLAQPRADHRPLPPGRAQRRHDRPLPRGHRDEGRAPGDGSVPEPSARPGAACGAGGVARPSGGPGGQHDGHGAGGHEAIPGSAAQAGPARRDDDAARSRVSPATSRISSTGSSPELEHRLDQALRAASGNDLVEVAARGLADRDALHASATATSGAPEGSSMKIITVTLASLWSDEEPGLAVGGTRVQQDQGARICRSRRGSFRRTDRARRLHDLVNATCPRREPDCPRWCCWSRGSLARSRARCRSATGATGGATRTPRPSGRPAPRAPRMSTKPGVGQQPARHLLAERRTEPGPALGQRDGHAVQRAHRVEQRSERVADVVLEVARDPRLLHHEGAARDEGVVDARQHALRVDLVVEGVEHEDGVEGLGRLQLRDVGAPRRRTLVSRAAAASARARSMASVVEVVARRTSTPGRPAPSSTRAWPVPQATSATWAPARRRSVSPGDERQAAVDQQPVVAAAAERVHHVGELGAVRRVRERRRPPGTRRRPGRRTWPRWVLSWLKGAMFIAVRPARHTACSAGSR